MFKKKKKKDIHTGPHSSSCQTVEVYSPEVMCSMPSRDEAVPISPTSQSGKRPAQRNPGGIQ